MTTKQKLEIRRSEIRSRLGEIAALDDLTEETRTEQTVLQREFQDTESRYRSAVIAETEEKETRKTQDSETRSVDRLRKRVSLAKYFNAAVSKSSLDGAEAEFNEVCEVRSGGPVDVFAPGDGIMIPMRLFAPAREVRAETDATTGEQARGWVDRLFAQTAAMHLGIQFASVPAGVAKYPITTGGGTPAQRGREEAATAAAWTIGVTELKPTRMSLHYEYAI